MSEFKGEPRLRSWLLRHGCRVSRNHMRHPENECNWYAYYRSRLPARRGGDDEESRQIVVTPHRLSIDKHVLRSVVVELYGPHNGVAWTLTAYSISPEEIPGRLRYIEASLVAAWNALSSVRSECACS